MTLCLSKIFSGLALSYRRDLSDRHVSPCYVAAPPDTAQSAMGSLSAKGTSARGRFFRPERLDGEVAARRWRCSTPGHRGERPTGPGVRGERARV